MLPHTLSNLLASGNGSLGPLPVPAIRILKTVLGPHNVEVYQAGYDQSEVGGDFSALSFGDSYVIAERFVAELCQPNTAAATFAVPL